MKRFPPRPLLVSLVLTTVVVWAVPRAILTMGAGAMAAPLGGSPELSPTTLLLLAMAVSGIVLLDLTVSRERVFAQNLGVAPLTVLGVAFGTAASCELVVGLAPGFLSLLSGTG